VALLGKLGDIRDGQTREQDRARAGKSGGDPFHSIAQIG